VILENNASCLHNTLGILLSWKQESAFDNYFSETKTGFGFNLEPVSLDRIRPKCLCLSC